MTNPSVHVADTPTRLVADLAAYLAQHADEVLNRQPFWNWALSGGSTPLALYDWLASRPGTLPWRQIRLYWGDERHVWPTDPASNFGAVRDRLLRHPAIVPAAVYRWPTELDPAETLAYYRQVLRPLPRVDGYPQLDLVLLGMGDDGHTASLFPGSPQESVTDWVAYGPGPHWHRYTLTYPTLLKARQLVMLVTGAAKAALVKACLSDPGAPYPAARLYRQAPHMLWFLDAEAAQALS